MITFAKPNTLGTLKPNDKFIFEGDEQNIFYFISNGINGFTCWNDTLKCVKTLKPTYENYQNIIIKKL